MEENRNTNNNTNILKQLIDTNPYIKGAWKAAEKQGESDFLQASQTQGGVSANQQLLSQIMQMTQPMNVPGTRKGWAAGTADFFLGRGFDPNAPQQVQLSPSFAMKLLQMQQEEPLRQIQMQKGSLDILQGLQQLWQQTPEGRADILKQKELESEAVTRGQISAKKGEARAELRDILENQYYPVSDLIPTSGGPMRYLTGSTSTLKGKLGMGMSGAAVQQLEGLNNRLRIALVRAAGDVGNIALPEQIAQQKLLFSVYDTPQLRELKKATLSDLSEAYKSNNSSRVKAIIRKWVNNEQFKKNYGEGFSGALGGTKPTRTKQKVSPILEAIRQERLRRQQMKTK